MKVLWFEVSVPSRYKNNNIVIGGWQDSLERIVRSCTDIDLTISFKSQTPYDKSKNIDGVNYEPMTLKYSFMDRYKNRLTWDVETEYLVKEMLLVLNRVKPDLIHVFGTEWPYAHIAKYTQIPVVVHIMGSIIPYMNALYPPMFSYKDIFRVYDFKKFKLCLDNIFKHIKEKTWEKQEREVWKTVKYYMGRTEWDCALSNVLHPGRNYFHVDEALRESFLSMNYKWKGYKNKKIKLISTGCSTFWKGPDMLLKVAKILTELDVDFEWKVAGNMPIVLKKAVERKLKTRYDDNHITFLGFTKPEQLTELLCNSTLYIHTAYIENSPNSICEAQCLGVPIISTNIGGISTLVKDGEQGILVPANDPWQMANAILSLSSDLSKMNSFSKNNIECALIRHNDNNIKRDLLNCYREILKIEEC